MRLLFTSVLLSTILFSNLTFADNGIISLKSAHSVEETANRLENALNSKGMTVFIRINHTEGAKKIGAELRPTQVVIFGNPGVGTPLMQCSHSTGIDLPQKALISEDENGQVWLSYNDPAYLVKRHNISGCDEAVGKLTQALKNFSNVATRP